MTTIIEWINQVIKSLNDYAGLLSLLAVLAAIIIPCAIYKKERKNERQAMQDELEAMEESSHFPITIEERKYSARKYTLEKRLNKR